MIQEVKEWFIRVGSVLTGSKQDREPTFNKQYPTGVNKDKYNVFLKGNIPSENVFKKLFASLSFKLNANDTAYETQQGLVQKATDSKSEYRDSSDNGAFESDGTISGISGISTDGTVGSTPDITKNSVNYTTTVLPHQLPNVLNRFDTQSEDVVVSSNTGLGLKISNVRTSLGAKFRRDFVIEVARKNQIIIDTDGKIRTDGYTGSFSVITGITTDNTGLVTGTTDSTLTYIDGVLISKS